MPMRKATGQQLLLDMNDHVVEFQVREILNHSNDYPQLFIINQFFSDMFCSFCCIFTWNSKLYEAQFSNTPKVLLSNWQFEKMNRLSGN